MMSRVGGGKFDSLKYGESCDPRIIARVLLIRWDSDSCSGSVAGFSQRSSFVSMFIPHQSTPRKLFISAAGTNRVRGPEISAPKRERPWKRGLFSLSAVCPSRRQDDPVGNALETRITPRAVLPPLAVR